MNKSHYFLKTSLLLICFNINCFAQGAWIPVTNSAPNLNGGVMLLLSDGTVITKTFSGGGDGIGNVWNKLTPDSTGSYINGTWSTIAPMNDTRLYFSTQLLKDGRVYVAGGEYGTGGPKAEIYDPQADTWTMLPSPTPQIGDTLGDANSAILSDGRVLQADVVSQLTFAKETTIYDPISNTYTAGPTCNGSHDEASWVKLPDNSILFVDLFSTSSERYIPATNQWITDATVPTQLYGQYDYETGPGFLLPDGRAFFIGSNGNTAYYTPSGSTANGTWAVGPTLPGGLGAPDAAAAMMVNGKILYALSRQSTSDDSTYLSPTYFYEFDYTTNIYTRVITPYGDTAVQEPCYVTNMLDLPDGTVLYADLDSYQYFIYVPDGTPLASGKPTINAVINNNCQYSVVGTLFNGISEGAAYGDDWQMSTNFPIVRLSNATNVYYATTSNWNSRGVQRGNQADTTNFILPANLPIGSYSLVVTANGISSDPYNFVYSPCTSGIQQVTKIATITISPNPVFNYIDVNVGQNQLSEISIRDMLGREIVNTTHLTRIDVSNIPNGVYFVNIKTNNGNSSQKIIVQH